MQNVLWYRTKQINQYTGQPNYYTHYKGLIINVYRMRGDWVFTCKFALKGEHNKWLQQSAKQYHGYPFVGQAQIYSIRSAESLLTKISSIMDPNPPFPTPKGPGEPTSPEIEKVNFPRRL